jgi:hypothetical protein
MAGASAWYLAEQHKVDSPSFASMYNKEHINFVVGAGPGLSLLQILVRLFYLYVSSTVV